MSDKESEFDEHLDESEEDDIVVDSPSDDELIAKITAILENIIYHGSEGNIDLLEELYDKLIRLIKKDKSIDNSLFFTVIDGLNRLSDEFEEDWDLNYLCILIDKMMLLFEDNFDNIDRLAALSNSLLKSLAILVEFELFDELEEYVVYLVNFSIDNSDNVMLRITASEATILAIKGFGGDWNFEKTKEFDIILKGLLNPEVIDNFLLNILLKGLAEEINSYGDMNEFSSMKRTLKLMKDIYFERLDLEVEAKINIASGFVNAINWFGEAEEYEDMIKVLDDLIFVSEANNEIPEIMLSFATGLKIALDSCGKMEDLITTTRLAKKLLSLADDYPENKKIHSIAIIGVFNAALWATAYWEPGMTTSLLASISKIYHRFPEDQQIKVLLGRGLFNITKELSTHYKKKLMLEIVDELYRIVEENPDIIELNQFYSQAIVNAVYMLGEYEENFKEIDDYLKKSEEHAKKYREDAIIEVSHSKVLVNAIRAYGLYGKIERMEELLDRLYDYTIASENIDVLVRLGKAYVDAIKVYGDINELDKIKELILEINEWVNDDPSNEELNLVLAKSLVNSISAYGKNSKYNQMNISLDGLRDATLHYPSYETIQTQLAKGITSAIRWCIETNDLKRCISLLHELKSISVDFSDVVEINEMVARSIRRIILLAYKMENSDLVDELLDNLRKLLEKYPFNEIIQIELARAITNIILEESAQTDSNYKNLLLTELRGLTIQYPNNEKLTAIHQTVEPLIKDS
ncbi:MAG: hypothetical protein FK734_15735 [Asgard group archaeon]|nr:hypothetical protein [Asgard group archaeon]